MMSQPVQLGVVGEAGLGPQPLDLLRDPVARPGGAQVRHEDGPGTLVASADQGQQPDDRGHELDRPRLRLLLRPARLVVGQDDDSAVQVEVDPSQVAQLRGSGAGQLQEQQDLAQATPRAGGPSRLLAAASGEPQPRVFLGRHRATWLSFRLVEPAEWVGQDQALPSRPVEGPMDELQGRRPRPVALPARVAIEPGGQVIRQAVLDPPETVGVDELLEDELAFVERAGTVAVLGEVEVRVDDRRDGRVAAVDGRVGRDLGHQGVVLALGLGLALAAVGESQLATVDLDHPPAGGLAEPGLAGAGHGKSVLSIYPRSLETLDAAQRIERSAAFPPGPGGHRVPGVLTNVEDRRFPARFPACLVVSLMGGTGFEPVTSTV